jgi:hypothetical protein
MTFEVGRLTSSRAWFCAPKYGAKFLAAKPPILSGAVLSATDALPITRRRRTLISRRVHLSTERRANDALLPVAFALIRPGLGGLPSAGFGCVREVSKSR